MKKAIFIGVFLFLAGNMMFAQGNKSTAVKWYTIEQAVELSKTKPKKFFIDVYTDWCGWCKKMDQTTFSHPYIAKYLNENFYPVKFNAESPDAVTINGKAYKNLGESARNTHELAYALLQGRLGYPSVVYLDENFDMISPVPGYQTPENMEPILAFIAGGHYKNTSFEDFQKKFESQLK